MEDKETSNVQAEEQEKTATEETKTSSHEETIAGIKQRHKTEMSKMVSKEEYNKVLEENKALKLAQLEEEFVKSGGKREAFTAFVKTNPNVSKENFADMISKSKQEQSFLYNSQEFNASMGTKADTSNQSVIVVENGFIHKK